MTVQSKTATRWQAPRWRDPRVLIGLVLVAACMAGTVWVVQRAAQTVTVWAAERDLAPGQIVAAGDLVAVEVKLPQSAERYISAAAAGAEGLIVLEPLGAGELVPERALGTSEQISARVVSLQIPGSLPPGVSVGSRIDLWAADVSGFDGAVEPREVLAAVPVVLVENDVGEFGAQRGARLDVLVEPGQLPDIMEVLAAEAHLTVVAMPEA